MKIIIHAVNIHVGGGRELLSALLNEINEEVFLSVDKRMPLPKNLKGNINVKCIKSSIFQRLLAELWLFNNVKKDDFVLCFGNLPPLFTLSGYTVVFLQNRFLVENISLTGFPLSIRLRLLLERIWVHRKLTTVDKFIVQTPSMKRLLETKLKKLLPIQILPYIAEPRGYTRGLINADRTVEKNYDFVYVASGEPHKNHRCLILAWCLLAKEGIYPSLCLTLDEDRFFNLCSFISDMRKCYCVNIVNLGVQAHSEVLSLYDKSSAAIYPSKYESFGLPLVEARQAGLPVLAAELDFVRDVLDPEQVFDPNSYISIARAVKRFMGVDEAPLPLSNASHFWASLLNKDV